jgi:hypothetical protein
LGEVQDVDVSALGTWLVREPQILWTAIRPAFFLLINPLMIANFWWATVLGPVLWLLCLVTWGASRRSRGARPAAEAGADAPAAQVTTLGRVARSRAVRLAAFVAVAFPVTGMIVDTDLGVSTDIIFMLVFDYLTVVLVLTLITVVGDVLRGRRAGTETQLAYAVTLLVLPMVAAGGYGAAWYFAALNYKPPW